MEPPTASIVHGSSYDPETDRRQNPRRRLSRRVVWNVPNQEALVAKTLEISHGGVSIMAPKPLPKGQEGILRFDFFFNGRDALVSGTARVMNCCCAGLDGFRVGLTFAIADPDGQKLIDEFLGA